MKTGVYMRGTPEFEELSKCGFNCIVYPEDCPKGCQPVIAPITRLRDEWWLGPEIIGYVVSCSCPLDLINNGLLITPDSNTNNKEN